MTRRTRRAIPVLLRLLLAPLTAGWLAGCGAPDDDGSIVTSGHVEATEVRISSKIAGRLLSRVVDEGDAVERGGEIARIDTVDLELALAAARAEQGQADADLRLKRAGYRREDIAGADALLEQATADLDAASKDLARMESLLAAGSGTEKARDDALARRDGAEARARAAREELGKQRAGYRREEIEVAAARLAAAAARIAQLEQNVRDASIVSPTSGIVTAVTAEPGELLAAGSPIVVVTDLTGAWLNVYVDEPSLGRIRLGQPVEVRTDGGEVREGRITFIASQAEFTPKNVQTRDERVKLVFRVKVDLANEDGLFKPGMPAEARIAPGAAASEGARSEVGR